MSSDVTVNDYVSIPSHELEITTSRSGGAGGQHVNKTDSRVTIRWNIITSVALTESHKQRLFERLQSTLESPEDRLQRTGHRRPSPP